MNTLRSYAVLIPLFLAPISGSSQSHVKLSKQIDSILTGEKKQNIINGNVLVIQNDQVVYEKSFGFADPEQKIKLNKETKFLIGSIYKEFPAVAIMQLHEKGLINIEKTIDTYLPDLPAWSKQISVKNLLQYSGGLPDINSKKYPAEEFISSEDVFNDLMKLEKLEYTPGTSYIYTNYSPLLLMKIVEKVSGKSFDDYAKTSLFSGAHIISESQYPYINKKNLATAYNTKLEADSYKIKIPFLFVSDAYGLYDWFKRIDENSMISETSKMFLGKTANIVSERSLQSPFGYLDTAKDSKTQTIAVKEHSHDGSFGNFKTIARRFNDEKLSIIILTNQNTNNVYQISNDIYKLVAKKIK